MHPNSNAFNWKSPVATKSTHASTQRRSLVDQVADFLLGQTADYYKPTYLDLAESDWHGGRIRDVWDFVDDYQEDCEGEPL